MYPESRKTYHIHSTLVKIAIVKKKNSYPQELTWEASNLKSPAELLSQPIPAEIGRIKMFF